MAVQEDVNVASVVSNATALQSSFLPTINNNGGSNLQTLIPQGRVVVASQGGKQNLPQVRFIHTIPANGSNQPQIVRLVKNVDGTNNLSSDIFNARGPLSSPLKGTVINFPVSAKVLTNSTKLKVGDTITIPKSQIVNENHVNISAPGLHTATPSTPTKLLSSVSQSPQPSASYNDPAQTFISSQSPYNLASPARLPTVPPIWSNSQSPMRQKRSSLFMDTAFPQSETKRRRTPTCGEKGNKGLRHFAMLVCEKVKQKVTTTYNEVADELVADYTESQKRHIVDQAYDQKNIRRRVYDALNVLMAMDIIYKDKKDIHWVGLPTNSAQEVQSLMTDKKKREQRIQQKNLQLQELILQQIAFKNLVQRNKKAQESQGPPPENSSIQLPFIIVNTSKKTVIDCSISNDKYEYMFNFNNTFEIHDDIEVLKRMGLAYGLEGGSCTPENLKIAQTLVPPVLKPYIEQMAGLSCRNVSNEAPSLTYTIQDSYNRLVPKIKYENCEFSQVSGNILESHNNNFSPRFDADDNEVAMATDSEAPSTSSRSSSSGLHSRLVSLTPLSGSIGLDSGSESRGSTPMDKSFDC